MAILEGNVALVTGSSRGIGAAIAKLFAQEGASVAVHGRDHAAVTAVHNDIERGGGRAMRLVGDVTSLTELEMFREQVEHQFGPVDIVVANAGGSSTPPMPVESMTEAAWRNAIDGNLTATFLTIKAFLPGMKTRKAGTIITVSSAAA